MTIAHVGKRKESRWASVGTMVSCCSSLRAQPLPAMLQLLLARACSWVLNVLAKASLLQQ